MTKLRPYAVILATIHLRKHLKDSPARRTDKVAPCDLSAARVGRVRIQLPGLLWSIKQVFSQGLFNWRAGNNGLLFLLKVAELKRATGWRTLRHADFLPSTRATLAVGLKLGALYLRDSSLN
jgi:hypothetical protein